MKHLFIGGHVDGAIIDVPEHFQTYRIVLPKLSQVVPKSDENMKPVMFPYEKYQREYLISRQHKEYSVFCSCNEDIDIVERLIQGYRRS